MIYGQIVTSDDVLRSIVTTEQVAERLATSRKVAIVNHYLYGVPSFVRHAKERGIEPIIGLTASIRVDDETIPLYVYAKNRQGYQMLMKLSSAIAQTENAVIPYRWLSAYSANCLIIAPVNDQQGYRSPERYDAFTEHLAQSTSFAFAISRQFGSSLAEEMDWITFAEKQRIPLTFYHEVRYLDEQDAVTYAVATAIRETMTLEEITFPNGGYALRSERQLKKMYEDRPDWFTVQEQLFSQCESYSLPTELHMPRYLQAENAMQTLKDRAYAQLVEKGLDDERYHSRLQYELDVIERLNFADYFLVVAHIIELARERDIIVGPGRGSSASSLVAYCLNITAIDPLRYGLVFERFLNEERVTIPDIDVDIQDTERLTLLQAVQEQYGEHHVAQIATYGTLSMRAVVRAVGRVLGISREQLDQIVSILGATKERELQRALQKAPELTRNLAFQDLWKHSLKLEHLPRSISTHAAGIVISPKRLVEIVPLQKSNDDLFMTQWTMHDIERSGLVKIDLLSLRNLTILQRILEMIRYNTKKQFTLQQIPLHDEKTYKLFQAGETDGIFQFESSGMKQALRQIHPERFEHIVVTNALYRPGPMAQIPLFAERKNNRRPIPSIHPAVDQILQETYGIIVYQEQIMQIVVAVAGFSYAEADLLRRAISKKDERALQQAERQFISGAMSHGMSQEEAVRIFQLIAQFAQYGFPKSHAVAYAHISYWLAYFKANAPTYYFAAMLSFSGANEIEPLIREAKRYNVQFLPPSLLKSRWNHTVEGQNIRLGFKQIKGLARTFYPVWKEVRRDETIRTIYDVARLLKKEFTEPLALDLIYSGACDELEGTRSTNIDRIPAALGIAQFGDAGSIKEIEGKTKDSLTLLEEEYARLQLYISEHPLERMRQTYTETIPLATIEEHMNYVKVLAFVRAIRTTRTKNGEAMAFVTVEDETATMTAIFFPKSYKRFAEQLQERTVLQLEGKMQFRRGEKELIVNECEQISRL